MIITLKQKFALIYGATIASVVMFISATIIVVFSLQFQSLNVLPPNTMALFRDTFVGIGFMFLPIALILSFLVGWIISSQLHSSRYTITPRTDDPIAMPPSMLEREFESKMNSIHVAVEKMREAYDQIQHFSVNASHELRTPLTIMRGEVELALRKPKSVEDYQQILGSLLEEILRLARIIDDLLLVAKSHVGQVDFKMESIDLTQLIEELADEAEVYTSQFELSFSLGVIRKARIKADVLRLRRVLLNLIDNAVKYNSKHGSVSLSLTTDDDFAYIAVKDTGIGIPESALSKIFDRFYRVDKEHSRSLGGTGLGLYIVKWITESHNGEVIVQSTPGSGSEFILKLPLDHSQDHTS